MKELILIPKYIYEQLKNTGTKETPKEKKQKLKTAWKTQVPPIPLRSINTEHIINNDKQINTKEIPLSDKIAIHFKNPKLTKAKQLLKYFENKSGYRWDNDGNIQDHDKNIIDIINDFLNVRTILDDDTMQYYKYLIYNLNIPLELIQNKYLKTIISRLSFPSASPSGKSITGGNNTKWVTY